MPRPRFERLKKEKRERILEAAAKAFAAAGFEQASMNQILNEAGISKGAAYYYFDDKADLYVSTIQYYLATLADSVDLSVDDLTAENFWTRLKILYLAQLQSSYEKPWVFGVIKSAAHVSPDVLNSPGVSSYVTYFQDGIAALLEKGQELGKVRIDLPQSLLFNLFTAVDETADDWFLAHRDEIGSAEIEPIALQVFETLKRVVEVSGGGGAMHLSG